VFLSGVQQIAKDYSNATFKKSPTFGKLSITNLLLFDAMPELKKSILDDLLSVVR
jgi:hypothetical protein